MTTTIPQDLDMTSMTSGFYMQYLESLCRRRGWLDPMYECRRASDGYSCHVLVNGREYQTDLKYESDTLAQENAAMRAFMVCRNFSVNDGFLMRNGVVQGLRAGNDGVGSASGRSRQGRNSTSHGPAGQTYWDRPREVPHRHDHSSSSSASSYSDE